MAIEPFEQRFVVRFFETDLQGELSVLNFMNFFEEVALQQSEYRGVGLQYYRDNSVIWMLHRWDISIFKAPRYGDEVLVRTLPVSFYGFLGYRKFWVLDNQGATLATADSAWIFLNTQTRRPMRVTQDMKLAYGHDGVPEHKMEMAEATKLQHPTIVKDFEVLKADIDIIKHTHNTKYVNWALETLPEVFLAQNKLTRLTVEYKRETRLGQMVKVETECMAMANGSTICAHSISNGENAIACALSTQWMPR